MVLKGAEKPKSGCCPKKNSTSAVSVALSAGLTQSALPRPCWETALRSLQLLAVASYTKPMMYRSVPG